MTTPNVQKTCGLLLERQKRFKRLLSLALDITGTHSPISHSQILDDQ